MQTLPFQTDIADRMLVNTENETIHPDAVFVKTQNGYWIAWHDQQAALLAPDAARYSLLLGRRRRKLGRAGKHGRKR